MSNLDLIQNYFSQSWFLLLLCLLLLLPSRTSCCLRSWLSCCSANCGKCQDHNAGLACTILSVEYGSLFFFNLSWVRYLSLSILKIFTLYFILSHMQIKALDFFSRGMEAENGHRKLGCPVFKRKKYGTLKLGARWHFCWYIFSITSTFIPHWSISPQLLPSLPIFCHLMLLPPCLPHIIHLYL